MESLGGDGEGEERGEEAASYAGWGFDVGDGGEGFGMAAELLFALAGGLGGDLVLDLSDDAVGLELGVVAAGFVVGVGGRGLG